MEKYKIDIAKDFSPVLGGRYKNLGPFSGEEFYESHLKPMYIKAKVDNEKLYIYLDGVKSYPSSFLDQSFGELWREYISSDDVKARIEFKQVTKQWTVDYINNDIWK